MIQFTLNGDVVHTEGGRTLLSYLREEALLTGAKNACGEGVCGACSVIVDGSLLTSCTIPLEKVAGKSVVTVEGIVKAEMDSYVRAFSDAGAVQCGFCTPGMVIAAKALLDKNPSPTEEQVRAGLRRNLCRCTGYQKIIAGVQLASRYRKGMTAPRAGSTAAASPAATAAATAPAVDALPTAAGIGARLRRVDASAKARGNAMYVDDFHEHGMLVGAALRTPHPRARLVSLDVSAALALPGVAAVATWRDIPGTRFTGHVVPDWPTLIAVGEVTRYIGDAVALVAAESHEIAHQALSLIRAEYEVLEPVRSPEAALASAAPAIHPQGNVLTHLELKRGDAKQAIASAVHVVDASFATPFTDHAFMEPESALAYPPDHEGVVLVLTGEQNVYDGRRYICDTLGLPADKVRVVSAFVGGGFGGKEDQTVQHHAALLAWLAKRPVKCTLSRAESMRVHVKRHSMSIDLSMGCDADGKLVGFRARIVADTGAYASLGGPVLHRAVAHAGGPYAYANIDVEGVAVFTNNPPAGAFRGFGVPQVNFAFESALDLLAAKAGLSPWEIRFRNAIRPGDMLPNGQVAGPDTALEECLLAVRPELDAAAGRPGAAVGVACGFKNTGLGMGHKDVGRCLLKIEVDHVDVRTGAACIGQGLATVLTQIACDVLSLHPSRVRVALPDTFNTPDSGTTTASRQTLVTGEACRRACLSAIEALRAVQVPGGVTSSGEVGPFHLAMVAGRKFSGEFEAITDPFESETPHPIRHIAYSYACQLVVLGQDGRVQRVVAAHDSGVVVNPLSFEGQVGGGVVMGLGFALTERFPIEDCVPTAKFGQLGLLRATDVPEVQTVIVRKPGVQARASATTGATGAAYGAKGIGEISSIPTAAAVAGAYFARDGKLRTSLPLEGTPYSRA